MYSRTPSIRTPIIRNADYPNPTLTKVIKAGLHSYFEKLLSALDNGLCLCAKASKFQTNLVTMSSMKRIRNVVTIETKLETIDQLAIGVRVSFLAVRNNIDIVIRSLEKINYPNHPWSQLVRKISILL